MIERNDIVERVFLPWRLRLGGACDAYKGHVYRVLNYTCTLMETREFTDKPDAKQIEDCVAVAACFHDVGIWLDRTMKYLEPSMEHARAWLAEHGRGEWVEPVTLMIQYHHKMSKYSGPHADWVESFRRADLVDVSMGMVSAGVPRECIQKVQQTFPTKGFHWMLVKGIAPYMLTHPWNPLPMMRR